MTKIKSIKQIIMHGILAGILLSAIYFLALFSGIYLFPGLVEEYYHPVFNMEGNKAILYFLHPFIVSFALTWFWQRFKHFFTGSPWARGFEVGLIYCVIAVLPSIWIMYSAFAVSFQLVISWLIYGILQGVIVGIFNAKVNP